jgi:hypothetical protein
VGPAWVRQWLWHWTDLSEFRQICHQIVTDLSGKMTDLSEHLHVIAHLSCSNLDRFVIGIRLSI